MQCMRYAYINSITAQYQYRETKLGETIIYGRANQKRLRDFKVTAPISVPDAHVRSVHREF